MEKNKIKIALPLVLTLIFFSIVVSSYIESYGTVKQDECISWTQKYSNATYTNFTSIVWPNQTKIILSPQIQATKSGSEYYYSACNWSSVVGEYEVCGTTDVDGVATDFCVSYEVTRTGNPTPNGMPTFNSVIILILFGFAWFMLYLSLQVQETGPKIFFFLLAFVFLMATIGATWQIAYDSNVVEGLSTTLTTILFVVGMILLVIFLYVMIRQTVVILDMFKYKKGLAWGQGVTGYQANNFMYR